MSKECNNFFDSFLFCSKDMQNSEEPLFRQELDTPKQSTTVMIPPTKLIQGHYLLIVVEKSSYENLW